METVLNNQKTYSSEQLASVCDHTFLKTVESYRHVARLGHNPILQRQEDLFRFLRSVCESRIKPYAICLRSEDIPHAKRFLDQQGAGSIPLVATVGFPDGSWFQKHYKFLEAQYALSEGASEIDMPLNWRALKQGDHGTVLEEIQTIASLVHQKNGLFKLILETSLLDSRQIKEACLLAKHAGVDFIKTSTGYGMHGARVDHIELILNHWDGGIKVSGGVNLSNVGTLLEAIRQSLGGSGRFWDPKKLRIGESELLELT
jgi:deoxyribose-phosphate aldolase